jgi:hypothetical protein
MTSATARDLSDRIDKFRKTKLKETTLKRRKQVSYTVLAASLPIALASWGSGFDNWQQLKEIANVFSLLGVVGGVFLAWLGKSPIKPKRVMSFWKMRALNTGLSALYGALQD